MSSDQRVGFGMDGFSVGDVATFERRWTPDDFAAFSRLSGDDNPLHHDAGYSAGTPFGRPVVPLHLTLSPLSMIAGTVFPGEPSLYLGHQVRAAKPVLYGELIRYSARIEAISASQQVLTIRVLALRVAEVVLDALMRVQTRSERWSRPPALPIRKGGRPATALITGGSGEIGTAIAVALAQQGWSLLIQDRGDPVRRNRLQELLQRTPVTTRFIAADLIQPAGRLALARAAGQEDDLGLIVHAASPAISAPVEDLVAVAFSALKEVVDASLERLLLRQHSAVVLLGSLATEYALPGWEAYSGAKAMAANLVDGLDRRCAAYGVRGMTLMPGLVMTRFSAAGRGDAAALLPQEVAAAVLSMVAERSEDNITILETGGRRSGRNGIRPSMQPTAPAPASVAVAGDPARQAGGAPAAAQSTPLAALVRRCLGLPAGMDLSGCRLGQTRGWDSLSHIDLLLAIEAELRIRFSASEIDATRTYATLATLCREKAAAID